MEKTWFYGAYRHIMPACAGLNFAGQRKLDPCPPLSVRARMGESQRASCGRGDSQEGFDPEPLLCAVRVGHKIEKSTLRVLFSSFCPEGASPFTPKACLQSRFPRPSGSIPASTASGTGDGRNPWKENSGRTTALPFRRRQSEQV